MGSRAQKCFTIGWVDAWNGGVRPAFASIVLIISHPYSIGDSLTFKSGALGGEFTGTIKDIGLTHTRIKLEDSGDVVLLPNAQILGGTSINFAGTPKPKK